MWAFVCKVVELLKVLAAAPQHSGFALCSNAFWSCPHQLTYSTYHAEGLVNSRNPRRMGTPIQ
jgi:hypothetical protein